MVSWLRTRARTTATLNGLLMKSTAPASSARVSSSGWFSAVTKMTGMSCSRGEALQRVADRVAVHAGHDGVEQDQVRLLFQGDLERLFAVEREQHFVFVLERLMQDLDVFHGVVHHEDASVFSEVGPGHALSFRCNMSSTI
jgi:hypothetical protein